MRVALHASPEFQHDMKWRLTFVILLPLFVVSEGMARLWSRLADDDGEPTRLRGAWRADARSQASIAATCALMAKSMLQSSERRNRSERLSRP